MVHYPLKITLALTFDDYKAPDLVKLIDPTEQLDFDYFDVTWLSNK